MTYYVVSLPSIDTRPTAQWYRWVKEYAAERNRNDIVLLGNPEEHAVMPTEFLDYREYFSYVFPQIVDVIQKVKNGDTVFFMDGETAGVEALEYVRKMEGVNVEIRTFWHSGTYDEYDLPYVRHVAGEDFERGWFDITDRIYVASEYHKQLLHLKRGVPLDKVIVTGCPLDLNEFEDGRAVPKIHEFMFAARKVPEKGYEIAKALRYMGLDVMISLDEGWSKKEFYHHLAASKMLINPAQHELFGTSAMEALGSNVPVIIPDWPNYRTVFPQKYLVPPEDFSNKNRFLDDVDRIMSNPGGERKLAEPYHFMRVMDRWFT